MNIIIIFIVILCIILILFMLWNLTPLRKIYFLSKSKSKGKKARIKLILEFKIMKKYGKLLFVLLHIILNFFEFFIIFKWQNGVILKSISDFFDEFPNNIITGLFFLTPYAREIVHTNSNFAYALNITTICSVIGLALFLIAALSEYNEHKIAVCLLSFMLSIGMWYAGFGCCYLVSLIPVFFEILALISTVLINIFIWLFLFVILILVGEKIDDI